MTDKPTDNDKENGKQEEETLLKFPCDFTIKAFGLANTEFEAEALAIVRKFAPSFNDTALVARPSENGKYMALSITIHAESKKQVDSIYQAFTDSPLILMAL